MRRFLFLLPSLIAGFLPVALPSVAAAQNNGNAATNITVQLPTFGIAVDAQGVLEAKLFVDPTGELRRQRLQAAQAQLAADIARFTPLRKVSLPRLERVIRRQLENGGQLDETVRYVAGLQRLQYVFCYPDGGEVIVAGPAEGWVADPSGRIVGMTTGQPVVELVDLAIALRAYPPGKRDKPFVGCTIDPPQAGLVWLQEFQRQIPHSVPHDQKQQTAVKIAQGVRDSLGLCEIRVFGIPADTHFARVMIEADYRMKLIGIGLERPPIKLASFLDLAGSARQGGLQRWWFTPNYDCVKVSDDHLAAEFIGQGVQLQGESKLVGPDGQLSSGAPSNPASDLFTQGFTRKYPELAARSPVFAQLRTLIDLLVASAYLQREDYYARAHWTPTTLIDDRALDVGGIATAKQAAAAVNVVWKGNRLISPAGGGVSIRADQALEPERLMPDERGQIRAARDTAGKAIPADRWWWD